MQRALASGAIVSSLFPEKVKQQLYEEQKQEQQKQVLQKEHAFSAFANGTKASTQSSKPIAELFHETTIMFADLAGFTAWSSTREPVEVFELLEALYGSFDKIALRRRVFKVETIGDCYLAVTGVSWFSFRPVPGCSVPPGGMKLIIIVCFQHRFQSHRRTTLSSW